MLELGVDTNLTIVSNTIRSLGDKEAVSLRCLDKEDDPCNVLIWLTPKAMGIARRQLKVAGFDCDKTNLQELVDHENLLKGNLIPVEVEEYRDTLQAKIKTQATPGKGRLETLQDGLRNAKKDNKQMEIADASSDDEDIPF